MAAYSSLAPFSTNGHGEPGLRRRRTRRSNRGRQRRKRRGGARGRHGLERRGRRSLQPGDGQGEVQSRHAPFPPPRPFLCPSGPLAHRAATSVPLATRGQQRRGKQLADRRPEHLGASLLEGLHRVNAARRAEAFGTRAVGRVPWRPRSEVRERRRLLQLVLVNRFLLRLEALSPDARSANAGQRGMWKR